MLDSAMEMPLGKHILLFVNRTMGETSLQLAYKNQGPSPACLLDTLVDGHPEAEEISRCAGQACFLCPHSTQPFSTCVQGTEEDSLFSCRWDFSLLYPNAFPSFTVGLTF